jgi:ubiquinone/menaquinone biosynthesis C-methylase UbiE
VSDAPDFARTYATDAARYDRLIRAEDADGALAAALRRHLPARSATGPDVLDVGAGTGRIARMLGDAVRAGVGVEPAAAMRAVAVDEAARSGRRAWRYLDGDARALPVPDAAFDVAVAAWVLGHLREWHPQTWEAELARALAEMRRALRPGGVLVVVDTLGTGTSAPGAPTPALAEYHAWLERTGGLAREVVRTDYAFASLAEAVELIGGFFGAALAARVAEARRTRVPEWTGLWTARMERDAR